MADHPLRPQRPARPYPLAGDDNSDWQAWRMACGACRHHDERLGCCAGGIVVYKGGRERGLPGGTAPGACGDWSPVEVAADA